MIHEKHDIFCIRNHCKDMTYLGCGKILNQNPHTVCLSSLLGFSSFYWHKPQFSRLSLMTQYSIISKSQQCLISSLGILPVLHDVASMPPNLTKQQYALPKISRLRLQTKDMFENRCLLPIQSMSNANETKIESLKLFTTQLPANLRHWPHQFTKQYKQNLQKFKQKLPS